VQIPSDKVPFNQAPDMKAYEITEAGKEALRSGKYKMVRPLLQRQGLVVWERRHTLQVAARGSDQCLRGVMGCRFLRCVAWCIHLISSGGDGARPVASQTPQRTVRAVHASVEYTGRACSTHTFFSSQILAITIYPRIQP
jgi:hypothetical protein